MRKTASSLRFSASDLVHFLGCGHTTWLDLKALDDPTGRPAEDDLALLLQERGREHERRYLEKLEAQGADIVTIPDNLPMEERSERTRDAMKQGASFIYQGALVAGRWLGYADFLIRTEVPSDLGVWSYDVLDVKLARTPTPAHLLQLCVYTDLLGEVQGRRPDQAHLLLGDGHQATFRLADYVHYYTLARQRFEEFCDDPPGTSAPEPVAHCATCHWKGDCEKRWTTEDHLSIVADIRRSQIKKLRDAGVETVAALAALPAGQRIPKLAAKTLARLRHQAALQVEGRGSDEPCHELILDGAETGDGRGFRRLPPPDEGDLFFDIEGDALFPDRLEFLFGLYDEAEGKPRFREFWAHNHDEERKAFERVIDAMTGGMEQHPDAHVYHYHHYEPGALQRLSGRYGTREAAVDNLLRRQKFVDLYKVVRESVRTSQPGYSLKNLEAFYMKREGEVKEATEALVVYDRWRKEQADGLLRQIADYNETDCRSTRLLRDWLIDIRPEGTPWRSGFESPEEVEASGKVREQEDERTLHERALMERGEQDARAGRELLAQLLEFHRREDKSQFWAIYNHQDSSTEALIEDPECLGGLTFDPTVTPVPDKKSSIYTYRFPPQEYKYAPGKHVLQAATLKSAGTIVDLDHATGTVRLKTTDRELPDTLSLIPEWPIYSGKLRAALYRYAATVIKGIDRHPAVRDLLAGVRPRLKRLEPGQPVIRGRNDVVSETIEVVGRMDGTSLFVQGPPGAGKTHTASHVIVDLLADGKKIGISSNSHKAINNLLAEVEAKALERGVTFEGIKKATHDESFFDGTLIRNVRSNREIDPGADLVAGTAWLFAREEFDLSRDYLFIDEAGQVSLANAVAMGLSAENIVLVGDQMQLGQPIQGVHPGGSGVSVLQHLLGSRTTIPEDRGIFLPKTWRMHPDVCRFISEAIYDGRLEPEESNANQTLLLTELADARLRPTGIGFVPVVHEGCSQKSEEGCAVLNEIYQSLLTQRFRDREGKEHDITSGNILVVAPYNLQVNHLKEVLPAGARVGTVDRFQGQQAEVVLVSLATSSAEEMPRDVEFLYSRNRLNVAISRARSLAMIIASPRLLEIPCRTVEQMRLVNTLCWVSEYAEGRA